MVDSLTISDYKIFVSHGSPDLWLAGQIAQEIGKCGATPFLDETNIPKGSANFKQVIRAEIAVSREFVALFTPWSAMRSWGWIDESDVAAGEAISEKIRESLKRASALIVIISERSLKSPWVQFELGAAEGMGKPVIPILIGPVGIEKKLPEWLQGLRYVDAR